MDEKILCIDDEPDTLTYYAEVLEDNDFIPYTAIDGIEGLKSAKKIDPDLIILDIMMPNKGGIKVYRELKSDENLKKIPICIISGISGEVDFISLLAKGKTKKYPPEGHLTKPITPDQLVDKLEDLLEKYPKK